MAEEPAETLHSAVWISLLVVNGQVVRSEMRPAIAPEPPKPKAQTPIVAPRITTV